MLSSVLLLCEAEVEDIASVVPSNNMSIGYTSIADEFLT